MASRSAASTSALPVPVPFDLSVAGRCPLGSGSCCRAAWGGTDPLGTTVEEVSALSSMARVANGMVGWLLRSSFSGLLERSLLLLDVRGRRTGRHYRLPVAPLPEARAATERALAWCKTSVQRFAEEAARFGDFPSAFMGLVGPDGAVAGASCPPAGGWAPGERVGMVTALREPIDEGAGRR